MLKLLKVEFRKLSLRVIGSLIAITVLFNTSFTVIVIFLNRESVAGAINPVQAGFVAYSTFNLLGVFLATGVMAAVLIASEYSGRTVSLVIASHGQRTEFVLAKYFIVFILVAVAPLISWVIGAFAAAVLASGPTIAFASTNWGGDLLDIISFIIRAVFGIALYSAVAVLIAFTSKSLVITLAGMVILFLVSLLGDQVFMSADSMQYAALLPSGWINEWLSTGGGFSVSDLARIRTFEFGQILFGLIIISVTVTLLLITVTIFNRRDIKEG